MGGFLIAVVSVAVILGFMILIHEFGHYAVAKLLGVRVEQFAIGFGKRLIGFRRGETDYRINLLPLGGYVKMSGENPMDERTGDPGEFLSHPRWHRFLIAIAGPAMNILLAVGLLTTVYMVHYEYPAYWDAPADIGWVSPDTPAAKAGIQAGDRIVGINGVKNPTWQQVLPTGGIEPESASANRGGTRRPRSCRLRPSCRRHTASTRWDRRDGTRNSRTSPLLRSRKQLGMPAEKAGIQVGDRMLSIQAGSHFPVGVEAMIAGRMAKVLRTSP